MGSWVGIWTLIHKFQPDEVAVNVENFIKKMSDQTNHEEYGE